MIRPSLFLAFGGGALLCAAGVAVWTKYLPEGSTESRAIIVETASRESKAVPLTPGVAALLSEGPVTLADRKTYLSTLGDRLPDADREALLDCIGNEPLEGLTVGGWHSLANDILEVIRHQQPATSDYSDRLVAMWHDRTLDATLRDYALQQLREWVADKDSRTVHEERPDKLGLIQRAFLDACTPGHPDCDPQSTTTGTALLAIDEWTGEGTPASVRVEPATADALLLAHASDASAHRGVRATALQLCARRRIPDALPLARELAGNSSTDVILRLAAVSLLGEIGDPEDKDLLRGLVRTTSNDPLLHGALAAALRSTAAETALGR